MGLGSVSVPGADPSASVGKIIMAGDGHLSPAQTQLWAGSTEVVDQSLLVLLVVGPPEAGL